MAAAVARLAAVVPLTDVDPELLISMAQVLETDGIIATSGGRFESSLVAKWEFREGSGNTTADTSGVPPEVPLTLSGEYSWQAGWGYASPAARPRWCQRQQQAVQHDFGYRRVQHRGLVAPGNVSQEEAWIVAYARRPRQPQHAVEPEPYNYQAFNRSTVTEDNNGGEPALATDDDAELAQASLQHVVVTFDPIVGRRGFTSTAHSAAMSIPPVAAC